MARHMIDAPRRSASARLARYLEIERSGRVHGRHPAVKALQTRSLVQGNGRPVHFARIERGRTA